MPINDTQRKKVLYPFLRRTPRLEILSGSVIVSGTIINSETIVRETIVEPSGGPTVVFGATMGRLFGNVIDLSKHFVIMNNVTGSAQSIT